MGRGIRSSSDAQAGTVLAADFHADSFRARRREGATVLVVVGTRPEVIKMAPVIRALSIPPTHSKGPSSVFGDGKASWRIREDLIARLGLREDATDGGSLGEAPK